MKSAILSSGFGANSFCSNATRHFWFVWPVLGYLLCIVALGDAPLVWGDDRIGNASSEIRRHREARMEPRALATEGFATEGNSVDAKRKWTLHSDSMLAFASPAINSYGTNPQDDGQDESQAQPSINSASEVVSATNAWGMERRVPWGETLDSLKPQFGAQYSLTEAFPLLRFRNLSDVGAFPAFGLMWGVENDNEGNYGSIWQWHDRLQASQKALFLEFEKQVVGIAFPSDFESNGNMYVATAGKRLRDGSRELEVLQFRLQKTPPFRLMTDRSMVVARGEGRTLPDGILHTASDGSLLVNLGEGSALLTASSTVRVKELPKGVWNVVPIFDSLTGEVRVRNDGAGSTNEVPSNGDKLAKPSLESVWGIVRVEPRLLLRDFAGAVPDRSLQGLWNRDLSIGGSLLPSGALGTRHDSIVVADVSTGDIWGVPIEADRGAPVMIAKTSRKLRRIGVDSNDEPLLIDADGRVLRLIERSDDTNWDMPERLSETGWYADIANGQMDPRFIQFAKGKAFEGHGDGQDYWVCVPAGETIDATKQGRWRFPDGTLLVQTLLAKVGAGAAAGGAKRMETRVLLRSEFEWYAYSYRWNEDESDAFLVPLEDPLRSVSTSERGDWAVPSRAQCNVCHIQAGRGYRLSFRHEGFAPKSRLEPVKSIVTLQELTERGVLGAGPVRLARPRGGIRQNNQAILANDLDRRLTQKRELAGFDAPWFKSSLLGDHLKNWSKSLKPSGALTASGGAFHVNMDATWTHLPQPHVTIGSQGNTLYLMSIATTVSDDAEYREAVTRGADFILEHFVDPNFGGFYESVSPDGLKVDGSKNVEGQAVAMLGLAYASQATGRNDYLEVAVKAWSQIKTKMNDPKRGWSTSAAEDFSKRHQCSQRALMHVFEALVTLIDITGSESLAEDAEDVADFVMNQLWREPGYLADEFDENWTTPIPMEDGKTIDIGNQAKWAFLLSESVRVGLPRRFLTWGQRLFDYVNIHGLDDATGAIGEPGNLQNRSSWQQAEFLRMLIRYADQHGREFEWAKASHVQQNIKRSCIDPVQGGWFEVNTNVKGSLTRTGEHEAGMYLEGIRFEAELQRTKAITGK
jgi:cellobiose epimerase